MEGLRVDIGRVLQQNELLPIALSTTWVINSLYPPASFDRSYTNVLVLLAICWHILLSLFRLYGLGHNGFLRELRTSRFRTPFCISLIYSVVLWIIVSVVILGRLNRAVPSGKCVSHEVRFVRILKIYSLKGEQIRTLTVALVSIQAIVLSFNTLCNIFHEEREIG